MQEKKELRRGREGSKVVRQEGRKKGGREKEKEVSREGARQDARK